MVNSLIYRDSSLIKFGQHKNPRTNNPVAPNSVPCGATKKIIVILNKNEIFFRLKLFHSKKNCLNLK